MGQKSDFRRWGAAYENTKEMLGIIEFAALATAPYSRVYVFIQKSDDEGSVEEHASIDEEQQQEPGADARLALYLSDAKWEAARRNAGDERDQIDPV